MVNQEEISQKRLKFAYWLVLKKQKLKKLFITTLVVVDLSIWTLAFFYLIQFSTYSKEYSQLVQGLTRETFNFELSRQIKQPLFPEILMVKAVPAGQSMVQLKSSRYHLVALVRNSNQSWHLRSFTYRFVFENGSSRSFKSFILPQEEKYLAVFDEPIGSLPVNLNLELTDFQWQKIKTAEKFLLEIPHKFTIKDLQHFPASRDLSGGIIGRDRTVFKFVNETFYDFWQIDLLAVLFQGQEIVALSKNILREILSEEERKVEIVWPSPLFFISETKVQAELDIFNPTVFMTLE